MKTRGSDCLCAWGTDNWGTDGLCAWGTDTGGSDGLCAEGVAPCSLSRPLHSWRCPVQVRPPCLFHSSKFVRLVPLASLGVSFLSFDADLEPARRTLRVACSCRGAWRVDPKESVSATRPAPLAGEFNPQSTRLVSDGGPRCIHPSSRSCIALPPTDPRCIAACIAGHAGAFAAARTIAGTAGGSGCDRCLQCK